MINIIIITIIIIIIMTITITVIITIIIITVIIITVIIIVIIIIIIIIIISIIIIIIIIISIIIIIAVKLFFSFSSYYFGLFLNSLDRSSSREHYSWTSPSRCTSIVPFWRLWSHRFRFISYSGTGLLLYNSPRVGRHCPHWYRSGRTKLVGETSQVYKLPLISPPAYKPPPGYRPNSTCKQKNTSGFKPPSPRI